MARKQYGKSQGRQVGRGEVRNSSTMTEMQQLWLAGLLMFLQSRKEAVFIGTPSTTGSMRINFYVGEEKTWAIWNLHEDWRELCLQTLSDLFDEEVTEDDVIAAAPWLARKAADAPVERKPTYRPAPLAEVPQKGS